MRQSDRLADHVAEALRLGRSRTEIAEGLRNAGWSGPEVDKALGAWADGDAVPPVPRPHATVSAREAFFEALMLVALGLGAIVERSAAVFTTIKLIGALYLVWVGTQAIIHRRANAQRAVLVEGADAVGHRSLFLDGFVVGVANPKTIVFFAAILPQFVVADGAPAGVQMMALGVIFAVIALASDSVWGLAAGTARQWFVGSPTRLELVGAAGGLAIVGLGVRLALTRRSD